MILLHLKKMLLITLKKKYDEVNNNSWNDVKDKAKEYFITIVDFIFYDGKIKGHTFNDLSSTAKLKIISIAFKNR